MGARPSLKWIRCNKGGSVWRSGDDLPYVAIYQNRESVPEHVGYKGLPTRDRPNGWVAMFFDGVNDGIEIAVRPRREDAMKAGEDKLATL